MAKYHALRHTFRARSKQDNRRITWLYIKLSMHFCGISEQTVNLIHEAYLCLNIFQIHNFGMLGDLVNDLFQAPQLNETAGCQHGFKLCCFTRRCQSLRPCREIQHSGHAPVSLQCEKCHDRTDRIWQQDANIFAFFCTIFELLAQYNRA